jgi:uncharacterized protein YecE (DUF72 family)
MPVLIGTGSWTDAVYRGVLYPKGLPAAERLGTYASIFDHVEVNSSYYATPRRTQVARWVRETRSGFVFHIKLHRAFSQSPDKTARGSPLLPLLRAGIAPLIRAERLGVFLLVMPPTFSPARHRLEELDLVAERLAPHPVAVELRHQDWVKGRARARTLDHFKERGLVWVAVDMPRIAGATLMPVVDAVTHPKLAYLRLHGRNSKWLTAKTAAARHEHQYTSRELMAIVQRVHRLADHAAQVHVVANNRARDYAPRAALALQRLLRGTRARR